MPSIPNQCSGYRLPEANFPLRYHTLASLNPSPGLPLLALTFPDCCPDVSRKRKLIVWSLRVRALLDVHMASFQHSRSAVRTSILVRICHLKPLITGRLLPCRCTAPHSPLLGNCLQDKGDHHKRDCVRAVRKELPIYTLVALGDLLYIFIFSLTRYAQAFVQSQSDRQSLDLCICIWEFSPCTSFWKWQRHCLLCLYVSQTGGHPY